MIIFNIAPTGKQCSESLGAGREPEDSEAHGLRGFNAEGLRV